MQRMDEFESNYVLFQLAFSSLTPGVPRRPCRVHRGSVR
jgi:hypothetical protein